MFPEVSYQALSLTSCCVSVISATEYHLGLLKAKLAKYRAQLLEPSKSSAAKGEGFDVMKSGDARVALIGFPSVGKVSVSELTLQRGLSGFETGRGCKAGICHLSVFHLLAIS